MSKSFPDPFAGYGDLRFRGRLEHWEVGYFCKVVGMWQWKTCDAARRPQAAKEAVTLALALMRESADRWNKVANDALAKEMQLRRFAMSVESGRRSFADGLPDA